MISPTDYTIHWHEKHSNTVKFWQTLPNETDVYTVRLSYKLPVHLHSPQVTKLHVKHC